MADAIELLGLWRWFKIGEHIFYRCAGCGATLDWRDHALHLQSHGITNMVTVAEFVRVQEEHVGVREMSHRG